MLNRIILIGRLTRDPEARYTPSGVPVTSFSVAVDRPQSAEARQQGQPKETDFVDIVTWRQTAEFAANYLQKGRLVAVEGRLQIREYVTQDGQRRKAAEVVADNVRPLDKPREAGEGGGDMGGGMGGNQDAGYDSQPAPRAAAPAGGRGAAPAGGGYERGGGGGGGGYERGGGAPAGGGRGNNAPPARGGRNTPPPADPFGDDDDIADPFAE